MIEFEEKAEDAIAFALYRQTMTDLFEVLPLKAIEQVENDLFNSRRNSAGEARIWSLWKEMNADPRRVRPDDMMRADKTPQPPGLLEIRFIDTACEAAARISIRAAAIDPQTLKRSRPELSWNAAVEFGRLTSEFAKIPLQEETVLVLLDKVINPSIDNRDGESKERALDPVRWDLIRVATATRDFIDPPTLGKLRGQVGLPSIVSGPDGP